MPQSLLLRTATALVAGALVVAGVFLLEPGAVAAVVAVVGLAGAWEWARLAGLGPAWPRWGYLAAVAAAAGALWLAGPGVTRVILVAATAWWLGVALWLARGAQPRPGPGRGAGPRWGMLVLGLLLLPSLMLGIVSLAGPTGPGRGLMLYAICLVWAADVGAYFVGRALGRHPLAPRVSAGKTWEGFGGGLLAVLLYAFAGGWILGVPAAALGAWVGLALVAGAVSVAGDLFESLLKREAGVKDSGALLPGHGGVLDRIDSLVAAIPVMALGLAALQPGAAP